MPPVFPQLLRRFAVLVGSRRVLACAALGLTLAFPINAAEKSYQAGAKEAEEIAVDLNKAIDKKFLGMLRAQPLNIKTDAVPILRITEEPASSGPRKVGIVIMSTGFIDLMNRVAHAKAIDRVEKGYFDRYLHSWPASATDNTLPALPNIGSENYWTEEVMDQQTTYFTQMVGTALGIKYANYYLRQYDKYAAKLNTPGKEPTPLNSLLSASEWEEAVVAGAKNALNCAYGMDGIIALLDCMDNMPKRPEWTLFFVPDASMLKLGKVKRDLVKIEKSFFAGG